MRLLSILQFMEFMEDGQGSDSPCRGEYIHVHAHFLSLLFYDSKSRSFIPLPFFSFVSVVPISPGITYLSVQVDLVVLAAQIYQDPRALRESRVFRHSQCQARQGHRNDP